MYAKFFLTLKSLFRFVLCLSLWSVGQLNVLAQTPLKVRGKVLDAKTNDVIPFANIVVLGTTQGTQSDMNGNFYLEITVATPVIKVSMVGYQAQTRRLTSTGNIQTSFRLQAISSDLAEVTVKGKKQKYRNKDNPAVALVRKVIEHKDRNRPESLDFYQYNRYEKLEFDLSNISEKFRNKRSLRKFDFVFDHLDTSKITGKVNLPMYLKETVSEVFYRKNPETRKERIQGEKMTGLGGYIDNNGIKLYLEALYQDVHFYDNNILLLTNQFLSPISPLAPQLYRYVIVDTTVFHQTPCISLGFAPRNASDQLFQGVMLVALDSTYAVRKVEMGFSKDINVNFVTDLKIVQEFDWVEKKGLMLSKDELSIEFNLLKKENGMGLFGQRSISYQNYQLNNPLPETIFTGLKTETLANANQQSDDFWAKARHQPLSSKEQGIYTMVDSVKKVPAFQRFMNTASFLLEGYKPIGGFEIGPVNTFYSFNPIEGLRLRLGGRTTPKFSERVAFETYAAYGFKDQQPKYFASATLSLTNHNIYTYPIRHLRFSYQNDIKIPGQELQFVQEDNFLLSFKRGVNNKMTYNQVYAVDFLRESRTGLAWNINFKHTRQTPAGVLQFQQANGENTPQLTTAEWTLGLRYAPNEQFYQGKNYRIPIVNKYPILQVRYTYAPKNWWGSNYEYSRLTAMLNKRMYVSPLGYADVTLEAGKMWGQAPYLLLFVHRANQTYAFQPEAYNLMNFLEFVSDQYAAVFVDYHLNGFFFNKIPLINRLKWREVVTCKTLWGGLSANNTPNSTNQLPQLPFDTQTQTSALEARPYTEVSIGIENIFKILRIDLLQRMTYLDKPNVANKPAIRFRMKFDF